jgi:ubiquitin
MARRIDDHEKRGAMQGDPVFPRSATRGRMAAVAAMLVFAVLCVLLLATTGAASAQHVDAGDAAPPSSAAAEEGRACFQPRALPACRSFWITEFGLQWFVSQPPGVNNERRWLATWEVGWMRNRSAADAVGGSIFLSTNDHAHRSGVRARYRRWTRGGSSVDVSPALIVFQSDEDLEVRAKLGAALQASVAFRDWIGLTTQVEAASGGVRFQAGVRLGGYPGAATGIGLPLFALLNADDS